MNLEESFGGPTARSPAAMIPLVVEECVCSVSSHPAGPHKALSGARGMPHWRYPWTDPVVQAQRPAAHTAFAFC